MEHEKVYAFCENLCEEETMTKEQIETKIDMLPTILSGTTEPTSEEGKDGDIYIMYS